MKKNRNEIVVGMFVLVGFILLTLTVFFVSGVYLFRSGYRITAVYDFVSILEKGAPVRMAGVRVGEVDQVTLKFDENLKKNQVYTRLFIEEGIVLHENYSFDIRGTHILSEPHIEITPIEGDAPLLVDGSVLRGIDPIALELLIEKAHDIASKIDSIMSTLNEAVEDEESRMALKNILINISELAESVSGMIQANEKEINGMIHNFYQSSESLNNIMSKIEKGDGTAGKLILEDELYEEIKAFVKEIKARPWRLLKRDEEGGKFLGVF
jgi:phospholipid/cholesterol/gamma-HCH transport system substrate-binding protein